MSKAVIQFPNLEQRITMLEQHIQRLEGSLLEIERKQRYPTFLTVKELADMLPISERTVHDWVSRGVIPFHKAGDRTLFLLDEILKWTKRHNDIQ